jgi:hypothetical protein
VQAGFLAACSRVLAAACGAAGRTQAAGQLSADLELVQSLVVLQGLSIGVDRPKLNALRERKKGGIN